MFALFFLFFKNPIFVIISDDMEWAISNIENVAEDIFYIGIQKPFPPSQETFSPDDQRGWLSIFSGFFGGESKIWFAFHVVLYKILGKLVKKNNFKNSARASKNEHYCILYVYAEPS